MYVWRKSTGLFKATRCLRQVHTIKITIGRVKGALTYVQCNHFNFALLAITHRARARAQWLHCAVYKYYLYLWPITLTEVNTLCSQRVRAYTSFNTIAKKYSSTRLTSRDILIARAAFHRLKKTNVKSRAAPRGLKIALLTAH